MSALSFKYVKMITLRIKTSKLKRHLRELLRTRRKGKIRRKIRSCSMIATDLHRTQRLRMTKRVQMMRRSSSAMMKRT
jgi:hypothetical protein